MGWAGILRRGIQPSSLARRLLEMTSMMAFSLVGAAVLHPAVQRIAVTDRAADAARGPVRWVAVVVCVVTAPAVLLTQALLDGWYSPSF
jgi:diguanylate cyclase